MGGEHLPGSGFREEAVRLNRFAVEVLTLYHSPEDTASLAPIAAPPEAQHPKVEMMMMVMNSVLMIIIIIVHFCIRKHLVSLATMKITLLL